MRGIALLLIYAVILLLVAERQFFDSLIPCLDTYEACPDSGSDFKDDEKNPPSSFEPSLPWYFQEPEPDPVIANEEDVDIT